MVTQPGPKNPNWKGGRTIASNGYVLIKMAGHHLADVRGYAYEHRIVAETKIGRRLRSGEQVHHLNGRKTDNRPENIEVVASRAAHAIQHRHVGLERRLPEEPNDLIECACGCGTTLLRFDRWLRRRRFINGHNL